MERLKAVLLRLNILERVNSKIKMEPILSILIGTINRLPVLKKTLDALVGRVKVQHEIIIIDAGSTDGTLDYLRQLDKITLISDGERVGQAASLNRVIKNLNSHYICWLSDDNVVMNDVLDEAVNILEADSQIGMVGLKVKDMTGHLSNLPYIGGVWAGILNCNQGMLPTSLMQSLGGFDEELRDYGIDIDLTTRVLLEGYKVVFTKRVAIQHYRDYETNTWIDPDTRKERLRDSRELFNRKYVALVEIGQRKKFKGKNSPFIPLIFSLYRMAGRRNISLEKLLGVNERDWRNVFSGAHISVWDFLINWGKSYYLAQKISLRDLEKISEEKVNLQKASSRNA